MGRVFLFVTIVTIGIFGLLFMSSSQDKQSTIIPTITQISPSPIQQQQQTQAPQQQQQQQQQQLPPNQPASVAEDPTRLAKLFLEEMASKSAVIKTSKGEIIMSFYTQDAINTVYNFVNKAKSGFYNNLTFHRVEDWVVQGGDPLGNGTGGNSNMPVEFNNHPFIVGSVGVASRGDGKVQNDAQFFITKKESSWLNGQYTNFGIVTKGMDVVEKMEIGDKILGITIQ